MILKICELCGSKNEIIGFHQVKKDVDDHFEPQIETFLTTKCKMGHKFNVTIKTEKDLIKEFNDD